MQIRNTGIPLAIATILFSIVPAKSVEYTTTTTTTTTDPNSVVYFYKVPTATLVTTIQGRRQDLEKAIDDARARGEISAEQSAAMKRELRRIALETGSNTISYPVVTMLASDLDLIGQQYGTIVTTAPAYVPIITGSTFTVVTGQSYKLDDFTMRRIGLESKITKALLKGRLTDTRANDLRLQLARIGNEARNYTSDGTFDAKESRRLYDAFDHVAQEIEKSAGKDNDPA